MVPFWPPHYCHSVSELVFHSGGNVKGNLCFVVFCCLHTEDPLVVVPYCAHFPCGLVPVLLACELLVYCDCTAEGLVGFSLIFGYLGSTHCNLSMADQGILFDKLDEIGSGLFGEELNDAEL